MEDGAHEAMGNHERGYEHMGPIQMTLLVGGPCAIGENKY